MKSHNYKGTVRDCFVVPDEMKCNTKHKNDETATIPQITHLTKLIRWAI